MKYLIILLLIIFPFGQLARWNFFGSEIVFHLNDLAVIGFLSYWLIVNKKNAPEIVKNNPLIRPIIFFLITVVISLAINISRYSPQQIASAILYPLRWTTYAGLFFVFWNLPKKDKDLARRWLIMAVIITAVFGLLQYVFVPNVSFLSAFDWDDHYYRLVGSFLDPGFTGAILCLGLILVFLRTNNFITLLILYSALVLTYSRASYLMYLVAFAAISFYKKSLKIVALAAIILGLTILILPTSTGEGTKLQRENSIIARVHNWQESVQIWSKAPIFGVGFNTYRYVRNIDPASHAGAGADSSVLLILATTGAVGLIAYLNILLNMWNLGRSNLIFKVSFLGIIIHSFFNNTLFYPWVMQWLWIALAIL